MTDKLMRKYIDWVYGLYPMCQEETLLEDIIKFHNSENLSNIFGITISNGTVEKIHKALREFNGKRLHCYCCGDLFPIPHYHEGGEVFRQLLESVLLCIDEVFECDAK